MSDNGRCINIAIDGPAGAGKSTIAKKVASGLGYIYIDTGAMYRAMAYGCISEGVDLEDEDKVSGSVEGFDIRIGHENGEQIVYLNGRNVNGSIRMPEVSRAASVVSSYGRVRSKLVKLQQGMAVSDDIVMDGRDIGTCVLKDAQVKIYLTASARVRAERRHKELIEKGISADIEEIEKEIIDRDYRDMHREISPLKKAEDAVEVDSSDMTIDEVVEKIFAIIREKTMNNRTEE